MTNTIKPIQYNVQRLEYEEALYNAIDFRSADAVSCVQSITDWIINDMRNDEPIFIYSSKVIDPQAVEFSFQSDDHLTKLVLRNDLDQEQIDIMVTCSVPDEVWLPNQRESVCRLYLDEYTSNAFLNVIDRCVKHKSKEFHFKARMDTRLTDLLQYSAIHTKGDYDDL